ncbi:MAG: hypothetical protein K2W96_26840 [Gemmataceae bacterium]|nr:hypothetical protein [Gemmataceae bacterium]
MTKQQTPDTRHHTPRLFFLVLAAMCVAAIALPIVYNLGQQLTQGQLDEAKARWREKGPEDYDLTFNIYQDRDPKPLRHLVAVRKGEVVFAAVEGVPSHVSPALGAALGLPMGGKEPAFTVPLVFAHLQAMLDEEAEDGRKNFLVAVFDKETGFPRRFVRRVRRSSTREEWNLKVWKPGELDEEAKRYR